jgi:hypothetical protein
MNKAKNQSTRISSCRRNIRLPALLGLTLILEVSTSAARVQAHDIYHNLWSPEGKRCCNDTDCQPVHYRLTASGVEMNVDSLWLPIPRDRIQYRLLASDPGHTRGGHWCGWNVPDEGLHTHCAILPPTVAAASALDALLYDPDAPIDDARPTTVISRTDATLVEQEFSVRAEKDENPRTCLRPASEDDLDMVCPAGPQ